MSLEIIDTLERVIITSLAEIEDRQKECKDVVAFVGCWVYVLYWLSTKGSNRLSLLTR